MWGLYSGYIRVILHEAHIRWWDWGSFLRVPPKILDCGLSVESTVFARRRKTQADYLRSGGLRVSEISGPVPAVQNGAWGVYWKTRQSCSSRESRSDTATCILLLWVGNWM